MGKLLLVFPLAFRSPVKTDEAGSTTSFIDVEMWEKLADYHAARLKKGMEVVLEGHLVQRRWRDAENRPHAVYRFIAQQLAVSDLKRRPEFDHVREAA